MEIDAEQGLEVAVTRHQVSDLQHRNASSLDLNVDAHVDALHFRARHHLARVALRQLGAEIDDQEPGGHGQQRVHDMFDPDDGDALRSDIVDELHQRMRLSFSETPSDFVKQQQFRLGCERARQFKPLAVEQRERSGDPVRFVEQSRAVKQIDGAVVRLVRRTNLSSVHGADQKVFEDSHALEGQRHLIRAADACATPLVRREPRDVLSVENNLPSVGSKTAGDQVENRGLARAIGAEDAQRLPFRDFEREMVRNLQRPETLRDIFEGKHDRHRRASSPSFDQYGIANGLRATGISGASLLSTTTSSYLCFSPFTHWPETSGVLQTFFTGPFRQFTRPTTVGRSVATIASRSEALSVGSFARLIASAATSNSEWLYPIMPLY